MLHADLQRKTKQQAIGMVGETRLVKLPIFLDEDGVIDAPKGPARKSAEHIVGTAAIASRPEIVPPPFK